MQDYVSNQLTHFVGRSLPGDDERYALLLRIFRSGTLLDLKYLSRRDSPIFYFDLVDRDGHRRRERYFPDPYFEVREDGPVSANEFVAPEMVCFCDIPVEQLAIHTSKYSRFGLAFSKTFLLTQGANPVHYVARNAATPLSLISPDGDDADFFANSDEHGLLTPGQGRAQFLEQLKQRMLDLIAGYKKSLEGRFAAFQPGTDVSEMQSDLLAMVEFMTATFCYVHGLTKVFDPTLADNDPDNYYMEREWRVIGSVKFSAVDVERVLVPSGFGDRFRQDEPTFAGGITEL